MRVHREGELRLDASVVSIGAFDGMHLGHQRLVRAAVDRAASLGIPAVVYTFDPPPKVAFGKARLLTPIDEKLRRLSMFEPDHVVVAAFDAGFARRPAPAFLNELSRLGPLEIWVGEDFRFGAGREGDVGLLSRYFDVRRHEPVCCRDGVIISSSRIRALIADGMAEDARSLHGWRDVGPAAAAGGAS